MRLPRAVAALVVAVAIVGCGGDESGESGRGDVAPAAWAGQVCAALAPWRTEIDALTTRAQEQMNAARTPDQAKKSLVDLLAGAEAASEQARAKVAAAGQPDAANGRRVAGEFAESLQRTRDAYGRAKSAVAALPTADAKAFYDGVSAVFGQLTKEYAAGTPDPDRIRSTELRRAFDEEPACR
jgi:hypothetical protein